MPGFNYEMRYLEAVLPQVEKYLQSQELYRLVFVTREENEPPYPSLTLGTLLLALKRAQGFARSADEHARWRKVVLEVEALRRQWHRAWQEKAKLDASSRLQHWENFIREYFQSPADQISRYAYEVRHRVILELLRDENPEASEVWDRLAQLDRRLQARWIRGEFLWEKEQAAQFPPEPYWFLWGEPL